MANEVKIGVSLSINLSNGAKVDRNELYEVTLTTEKFSHGIAVVTSGVNEDISLFTATILAYIKAVSGNVLVGSIGESGMIIPEGQSVILTYPMLPSAGVLNISGLGVATAEYIIVGS